MYVHVCIYYSINVKVKVQLMGVNSLVFMIFLGTKLGSLGFVGSGRIH